MKYTLINYIFLITGLLLASAVRVHAVPVSPDARFTILSCSPGPDLYSVFGHSAIRFEDVRNGRMVDEVYNYGTFEFDEGFYWNFAKGRLNYKLSRSSFGDFQHEYLYQGRNIREQELRLTHEEKQRLYDLLIWNYQPENRVYRYDFFYDNCATRIRDIVVKSSSQQVSFTYVYGKKYTFRDAIQNYLDFMPWSDFGIDLALGMPCDREMSAGDAMFLPDSLEKEFNYAVHGDGALVAPSNELIPAEFELSSDSLFTPLVVFWVFFGVQLLLGWKLWREGRWIGFADRLLLFASGLVGVVLVFLWFFTDHQATKWNLNLLWANPLNLVLAFVPVSFLTQLSSKWWAVYAFAMLLLLVGWFWLPQRLHAATIPMILGLVLVCLRCGGWIPKGVKTAVKM